MKLIDKKFYKDIMNKFHERFKFNQGNWFKKKYEKIFNLKNKTAKIYMIDDNNQFVFEAEFQKNINDILSVVINEDIYAIDPFHDFWGFNPHELTNLDWTNHGDTYGDIVSDGFPCFYPNGEDFFFVTKDMSKGILCLPGFGETYPLMIVIGQKLIDLFEKEKQNLYLLNFDRELMDNYKKE